MQRWRFGGWGTDKWQHFLAGAGIAICASIALEAANVTHAHEIGLVIAIAVGAGKEVVHDWIMGRGTPEVLDFLCTALGGILAYLIL